MDYAGLIGRIFMAGRSKRLRKRLHRDLNLYYRATSRLRPLPNALIIGGMKCGTTTLNSWLRSHPEVAFSAIKEIHYFDQNYDKGEGWYRSFFPIWEMWTGAKCVIEATPAYLFRASVVAPRMHSLVPSARLILMLRDPVKRAISHYGHRVRNGEERRSIEDALLASHGSSPDSENIYKTRGLYADQIREFLRFYPIDNLMIVKSEDFFADPASIYFAVQEFLGLSPKDLPEGSAPRNVGQQPAQIPESVLQHLAQYYRTPNQELSQLLPWFSIW